MPRHDQRLAGAGWAKPYFGGRIYLNIIEILLADAEVAAGIGLGRYRYVRAAFLVQSRDKRLFKPISNILQCD